MLSNHIAVTDFQVCLFILVTSILWVFPDGAELINLVPTANCCISSNYNIWPYPAASANSDARFNNGKWANRNVIPNLCFRINNSPVVYH